jgi:hypothetical protein
MRRYGRGHGIVEPILAVPRVYLGVDVVERVGTGRSAATLKALQHEAATRARLTLDEAKGPEHLRLQPPVRREQTTQRCAGKR